MTRHVLSAAAKFYGVGWRFVKPKKGLPIDAAIALAMAHRVLLATSGSPETPEEVSVKSNYATFAFV